MHKCISITIVTIGIIALFGEAIEGVEDSLDAVVVIYRHGDRTPVKPYPTDPYRNASYWPVGFGQLTNLGKQQHLELGKWFRNRYQHLLPLEYSEKDIYVRSTDYDRTIMSAQANLAGLYPPVNKEIWDKDIKWQPIPVHSVPKAIDDILTVEKICPKYDMLTKELFKSSFFRNISHHNHDLYAYLSRNTGDKIVSLETLEYLYNTFEIETFNNFTLPTWTKSVYPEKMRPWAFLSFATQTFTQPMARLKTGLIFNTIVTHFKSVASRNANMQKMLVFSAHDTTIANVLNSMGAFEYHSPPYASSILFELKRRSNGRTYVNILYRNTTEAPRNIFFKDCDFNCDLIQFTALLSPITLNEVQWKKECFSSVLEQVKDEKVCSTMILALELSGLIVLFVALILLGGPLRKCYQRRKKEGQDYTEVPDEEYA